MNKPQLWRYSETQGWFRTVKRHHFIAPSELHMPMNSSEIGKVRSREQAFTQVVSAMLHVTVTTDVDHIFICSVWAAYLLSGAANQKQNTFFQGHGEKKEDLWTLGGGASAGGGTSPALVGAGRVRFDIETNPCVQEVPKFKPSPRRVKHKLRSNRTPSDPCLHCSYWGGVGSEWSSLGWGNEEINEGPKIRLPVKWLLGVWGLYLLAWYLLGYSLTAEI